MLSWAWLVLAVILLIDLAVQSRSRIGLDGAALVLAISGIVYGCAWRPRVVADAGGLTLVNPLREYRVPWGAVARVDSAHALQIHCTPAAGASRGKVLSSWAVQRSPRSAMRPARRATAVGRRTRVPAGYGEPAQPEPDPARVSAESTAARIEERAQHARQAGAAGGQPAGRWAWAPIAAMVLPAVAFIIIALA